MVTEGVVDGLESVEVAEAQGHGPACAGRRGQSMLHPIVQEGPVGQSGELVVECQMPQIALECIAFPVGRLERPGVFGDLVGLAGYLLDEPHHSQIDESEDRRAQPGHHRNVDIQFVVAGHQQDGRGDEPGKRHDRNATAAIGLGAIDAGHQFLRCGERSADRRMQGGHSDQDVGGEEQGIDKVAGLVAVVEHQQVVDEVGQKHADQRGRQQLAERLIGHTEQERAKDDEHQSNVHDRIGKNHQLPEDGQGRVVNVGAHQEIPGDSQRAKGDNGGIRIVHAPGALIRVASKPEDACEDERVPGQIEGVPLPTGTAPPNGRSDRRSSRSHRRG